MSVTEEGSIRWSESINIGLGNRDGELLAVKGSDGKFYLVLEADTLHNPEIFHGMGSTEHIEISEDVYVAISNENGSLSRK